MLPQRLVKLVVQSDNCFDLQMIAGKKYHGLTVDIWSCGVILFAMICGYLPFEVDCLVLSFVKEIGRIQIRRHSIKKFWAENTNCRNFYQLMRKTS